MLLAGVAACSAHPKKIDCEAHLQSTEHQVGGQCPIEKSTDAGVACRRSLFGWVVRQSRKAGGERRAEHSGGEKFG